MDFPNSLQDQQIESKKKSSFYLGFLLLFAVSVGLNFYLIFFEGENSVEMAEAISAEGESANLVESQVEGLDPEKNIPFEEIVPEGPKIQKISFTSSDGIRIGDIAAQSLDFKVRNSLNYTVCKIISRKEGCAALSAHLGRLMSWFFDVNKSIRNGDAMRVVYQRLEGPEQFKILKLSYKSKRFGKTFVANYFDGLDQDGYFDSDGKEIAKRIVESQSPMRTYTEITSLPGDFRKGVGGHSGTDFKAPVGTPVYSGFKGKVTRANWNVRANGYCVEIDHPEKGVKTLYLHLSRVLVKSGQTIKAGQQIAESGNTGRTFAPHLHYEIQHRKNRDRIYNPFTSKHHKYYTRNIPVDHLEQFNNLVKQYDSFVKQS
ncbi:MAG: M23 family metallopeptidase [Nitrospinae bacterium]|nr:M23 family metallopeptidase [Nitrospinota bacterium]